MKRYPALVLSLVLMLGIAIGIALAKGIDPSLYHGKDKKEAARALLELARKQAGRGSWERIGVGRVYYLGGMKSEGQAIFDEVTSQKPKSTDWWRLGRVYGRVGQGAQRVREVPGHEPEGRQGSGRVRRVLHDQRRPRQGGGTVRPVVRAGVGRELEHGGDGRRLSRR